MAGKLGVTYVAAAIALIAVSAAGQNQVFNGSFARDLRGWAPDGSYLAWNGLDGGNSASSGSLRVINTANMSAEGLDQCLAGPAPVAGATYTFGGRLMIPSGQASTGWAAVGFRWYGAPGCTGSVIDGGPRAQLNTADGAFHSVTGTYTAPAGAVSTLFLAYATKSSSGGMYVAYLDDLYYGPAGATVASPPAMYISNGAHSPGYGGAVWRTDLEVQNPTAAPVSYSVELLKRDQDNSIPLKINDQLSAGASKRYPDIVATSFGFQGAAALRVSAPTSTLAVTSRTFNQTSNGTYGQYIPGIPDYEAIPAGGAARLVQLTHNQSTTSGYRTNIGFLNAVDMPITIEVKLYDGSGTLLGTLDYDLLPYEFKQIDKIFQSVIADDLADGYAIVSTTTPNGRFFAYAAVIDNVTSDPICVQPAEY